MIHDKMLMKFQLTQCEIKLKTSIFDARNQGNRQQQPIKCLKFQIMEKIFLGQPMK